MWVASNQHLLTNSSTPQGIRQYFQPLQGLPGGGGGRGGGRGGSGGRGGGGRDVCFKCQKSGHWASNCPNT